MQPHEPGNTIINWLFPAFCGLVVLWQIAATLWNRRAEKSVDPVALLRRAIMHRTEMEACAALVRLVFDDPICQTSLIDYRYTKQNEKMTFKPAGLSQLLVRDEKFDQWRQQSPKNQSHFVQVVVRLRGLVPEHVHDI